MRRRYFLAATLLAALAGVAPAVAGPNGSDDGTMCVQNTRLLAENETTGSTSTATGHAQIKVRNDGTIEWKVFVLNPDQETFVAGHIHLAPAGVAGPVVLPLHTSGATTDVQIRDSAEASGMSTLGTAICANPEAYYVNYHTTAFPGGAVRGQLG
ncbi:MAG TPA: CHRD domain-containing protein [Gaiellaceae bacterium]